ncbi:restriction endonuclease [Agrobacterium tumefaciens]|uniref:restriction endonuclease n=1 Tax=Agrobacterium tumefaciens complex TaxID=1183400 RepID=UPI000DD35C4B|nr:restriction system protein [Agrobacterium tumefaciens]
MKPDDLPRYDDLLTPTLRVLASLGGSGTISEIEDAVFASSGLPEAALNVVYEKSGAPIFPDRCSWARSYLKMAGLLDSGGRGIWVLTEAGRNELSTGSDDSVRRLVSNAYNERAQNYRERTAARAATGVNTNQFPGAPIIDIEAEAGRAEIVEAEDVTWTDRLLSVLAAMQPDAFERLCQRLLRESGFTKVDVTGKSGDGGIDGHGVLRMNLISFQVLFQAKRWQSAVGSSVVRDFRGAMVGRADKGLIITTSSFTRDARAEATRDGAPAIDLIDGEDLCRLLKENSIGVRIKLVEEVEIDQEFFSAV